jgi:hypothetical protein
MYNSMGPDSAFRGEPDVVGFSEHVLFLLCSFCFSLYIFTLCSQRVKISRVLLY